jgi:hypothetical protein
VYRQREALLVVVVVDDVVMDGVFYCVAVENLQLVYFDY